MTAALYVRVSTGDQDLASQEASLRTYAEAQDWQIVDAYRETVTGTGRKARPEFDRLRGDLRTHSFDIVLVAKLDRLGRSVRDVLTFFEECELAGVRIVVKDQAIDTGTPVGRLTRTILAGIAEFEGELIRERTRTAMAAIKAGAKRTRSGRMPGRPRKIVPEIVERARNLHEMGHSWSQVAQLVGLKAETLRRAVWVSKSRPGPVENATPWETVNRPGGDRGGE